MYMYVYIYIYIYIYIYTYYPWDYLIHAPRIAQILCISAGDAHGGSGDLQLQHQRLRQRQ